MREIKFRAWIKPQKTMRDIISINFYDKTVWIDLFQDMNLSYRTFDFDDVEIMQYTGLKDKNGKEIYEGNIVEYLDASGFSLEDVGINRGIVELDLCEGINFTNRDSVDMEDIDFEEVEIIGNIYENTELLNK